MQKTEFNTKLNDNKLEIYTHRRFDQNKLGEIMPNSVDSKSLGVEEPNANPDKFLSRLFNSNFESRSCKLF